MSGYTDDAIVHHGVIDPGTQLIGKPFAAADLTRRVDAALGERRDEGAASAPAGAAGLDPAALGSVPLEVRQRLERAVVAARHDEIGAIAAALAASSPELAAALRRLLEEFDYAGMRELLG
jgi:hypothetical protein